MKQEYDWIGCLDESYFVPPFSPNKVEFTSQQPNSMGICCYAFGVIHVFI